MLGQSHRLVAQCVHRLARLLQSLDGETPCLLDQLTRLRRAIAALQERVGGVQLDRQGPQGVGQHVVDLAPDSVALSQRGRSIPLGVGPDPLGQELLGLKRPLHVLAAAGTDHEPDDDRDRPLGDEDSQERPAPTWPLPAAPTPIAPTPSAGSASKAIPAPSPATAMKVMAMGANAARAPPDAARRARKHHVVRLGARSRRLAIQPSQPIPAPTISTALHRVVGPHALRWRLVCGDPEESARVRRGERR